MCAFFKFVTHTHTEGVREGGGRERERERRHTYLVYQRCFLFHAYKCSYT